MKKVFYKIGLTLTAAIAFSGCVKLKDAPTSAEMKEDNTALDNMQIPNEWAMQEMDSAAIDLSWVKEWETDAIDALIAEACLYNADIQVAASRIEQANQGLKLSKSRMKPQVGIGASGGYAPVTNTAAPSYGMLNASWEMDLWGKLRYGNEKAQNMIYSAEYADKKLRQVLSASIARAYYTAVFIKEQKELLNQAIEATNEMATLNEARVKIGVAKESDVLQMNAQEAKFKEQLVYLDQKERDVKRSIELLMGRYPKGEIEVAAELINLNSTMPESLPLSMLENRPEIMISQYAVENAFYDKKIAEASRWPSVSLDLSFGGVNSILQSMWSLSNPILSIGGSLTTPIFTGGAIKANIAIQNEAQKQAVLYYAKSYLNALSEIETNLNGINAVEGRFEQSNVALKNLKRTYELSELQYKVGNENMFTLLQKQLQLLNEGTNQLDLRFEKINQRISLYMALGGDYVGAEKQ
ncbi:TolC family protein [Flammeovirga agarivorans]|uniref:TolC family protein n=1 Tax=Flammeovirga agarivorans TaxID=2726742 RepID=A0A7X8XTQ7_9BACT|nr:TolC family protein [Flammeovirga agarivorans]NLR89598.1 TolC family protein [Flammeovirga agarivorans]